MNHTELNFSMWENSIDRFRKTFKTINRSYQDICKPRLFKSVILNAASIYSNQTFSSMSEGQALAMKYSG